MKKLLLGLTLGMLLVSCSQDDSLNNPISNEVCECDRVVEATTFNGTIYEHVGDNLLFNTKTNRIEKVQTS
jgi:hypothetical protein